ncbi:MAG: glycosyltransferase family 2 protein [Planctomycetota bacterium]
MNQANPNHLPSFSIILPVYNEEAAINETIEQLKHCLEGIETEYEIIAVNDGSEDESANILRSRTDVKLLEHDCNRGYGAALKTGILAAEFDWIVITDSDGTYPNERIPELLRSASNCDMLVGARTGEHVEYPLIRKLPKWFLKRFAEWMVRRPIPDINSGLRAFRKSVCHRFLSILPDGFSFTTTITIAMMSNNYRVIYVPIDYASRIGKSKIRPIRDTLQVTQVILRTGMYFAPLRVFLPISALFFVAFLFTFTGDIFLRQNLTERSLILFGTSTQLAVFALLADMIDKRCG